MRTLIRLHRRWRETQMFVRAMASDTHPITAQIVPIRRCNLACAYCNEFDKDSPPVPTAEMLRRIDKLGELRTAIITFSGGEPTLHPDLDLLIRRAREHGAIATIITNGYLLTPERIKRFNAAGLDYLQISIDNVQPDEVSKKSLKVLDRKLEWLAEYAEFAVTVNSVLGETMRRPEDALTIARRARSLGFNSTIGILHDGGGQTRPLPESHTRVYEEVRRLDTAVFSFSHFDRFQRNLAHGRPNEWRCRAGSRFLYVCEDGLVHYCSQQRGQPGIPLAAYSKADLEREYSTEKSCAPFCSISCVHQTAMLDEVRERPREMLRQFIELKRTQDPSFQPPALLRLAAWAFLESPRAATWGRAALRLLGAERKAAEG